MLGRPKVLILRLRHVPVLDATGLQALENMYEKALREGTQLILSGVTPQPRTVMNKSGFIGKIGAENVFDGIDSALERARELVPDAKTQG